MSFSRFFSIRTRFLSVLVIAMVCVAAIQAWSLYTLRQGLMEDKEVKTRHLVEVAHGVLSHYHGLASAGRMSEQEAQAGALALIRGLRYERDEYFWINDMQPRMVMHPFKPELEGKDLAEVSDPSGKKLFLEFVEVARTRQAGFVHYLWPKAGSDEPAAKISYVKVFVPWGWVIGSGVYLDDVEAVFLEQAARYAVIAGLLMVLLGAVIVYMARSVTRPLAELRDVMVTVRESHDLTVRADIVGQDEISQMAEAFNGLQESVREIVLGIADKSRDLSARSHELARAAHLVTETSASQSDSASASAAAMEEIGASVATVVEQAEAVLRQANDSLERTRHGNESLSELVGAIMQAEDSVREINGAVGAFLDSTSKITFLTQQVRAIAEQTNLLALNAAIEAARAGEAGRGFAVVADEVRKLAEKSATAAGEIDQVTQLVDSQSHTVETAVAQGAQSLEVSGAFLENLAEVLSNASLAVAETEAGVGGITGSVREQRIALEDIGHGMEQVAQGSEKNSVAVQDVNAAVDYLGGVSAELQATVARFRV